MLTTWYPPLQSVAVNRMAAFVKYLDHSQFELVVITLGNEKNHGCSNEDGITVFRIKPRQGISHPTFRSADSRWWHYAKVAWRKMLMRFGAGEHEYWVKEALAILHGLHKEKRIDLLFSSFSPAAPHVAALQFCREIPTPWIVDMRDEMSLNPQSDATTRSYYAELEGQIAKHATALTSVSQPIVDYFKAAIPGLREYVEIRNGFDHEMLTGNYTFGETFTLLHAGSFYGSRKPGTLMRALVNLDKNKALPPKWKFICAGASRNFSIPDSIKDHVEIQERVSQPESIALMRMADLNVLVQPPTGRRGVYTGKIFDYLSVLKPILAVVDSGDVAAELILETNSGFVSEFSDVASIEANLLEAVRQWRDKKPQQVNTSMVQKMHRKYQVQNLNLLIENLLHEK